jgi:hypothetical protein
MPVPYLPSNVARVECREYYVFTSLRTLCYLSSSHARISTTTTEAVPQVSFHYQHLYSFEKRILPATVRRSCIMLWLTKTDRAPEEEFHTGDGHIDWQAFHEIYENYVREQEAHYREIESDNAVKRGYLIPISPSTSQE